jgi:hypothetical protein
MSQGEAAQAEKPFLNTLEAAAWLRLTKNTLEKMRYHIEDLVEYSQANRRRSTSDVA